MILYALACDGGHRFESWFRDSAAYEAQASADLVTCPLCRSAKVAKAIMAPAVVGAGRAAAAAPVEPLGEEGPAKTVALIDDRTRELRAMVRGLRARVIAEGHDMGDQLAAEARRIHDGEAPERQIYGQASVAEARDLLEDGIMVLPLPNVPEELN